MFFQINDESESERFAALAEMVRRKAPQFMRAGGQCGFARVEWRRISDAERAQIIELRRTGLTMREVGERVGRAESVVASVVRSTAGKSAGWRRGPKRVDVDVGKIQALRARGLSWDDVAREMGRSKCLLQNRLKEQTEA